MKTGFKTIKKNKQMLLAEWRAKKKTEEKQGQQPSRLKDFGLKREGTNRTTASPVPAVNRAESQPAATSRAQEESDITHSSHAALRPVVQQVHTLTRTLVSSFSDKALRFHPRFKFIATQVLYA